MIQNLYMAGLLDILKKMGDEQMDRRNFFKRAKDASMVGAAPIVMSGIQGQAADFAEGINDIRFERALEAIGCEFLSFNETPYEEMSVQDMVNKKFLILNPGSETEDGTMLKFDPSLLNVPSLTEMESSPLFNQFDSETRARIIENCRQALLWFKDSINRKDLINIIGFTNNKTFGPRRREGVIYDEISFNISFLLLLLNARTNVFESLDAELIQNLRDFAYLFNYSPNSFSLREEEAEFANIIARGSMGEIIADTNYSWSLDQVGWGYGLGESFRAAYNGIMGISSGFSQELIDMNYNESELDAVINEIGSVSFWNGIFSTIPLEEQQNLYSNIESRVEHIEEIFQEGALNISDNFFDNEAHQKLIGGVQFLLQIIKTPGEYPDKLVSTARLFFILIKKIKDQNISSEENNVLEEFITRIGASEIAKSIISVFLAGISVSKGYFSSQSDRLVAVNLVGTVNYHFYSDLYTGKEVVNKLGWLNDISNLQASEYLIPAKIINAVIRERDIDRNDLVLVKNTLDPSNILGTEGGANMSIGAGPAIINGVPNTALNFLVLAHEFRHFANRGNLMSANILSLAKINPLIPQTFFSIQSDLILNLFKDYETYFCESDTDGEIMEELFRVHQWMFPGDRSYFETLLNIGTRVLAGTNILENLDVSSVDDLFSYDRPSQRVVLKIWYEVNKRISLSEGDIELSLEEKLFLAELSQLNFSVHIPHRYQGSREVANNIDFRNNNSTIRSSTNGITRILSPNMEANRDELLNTNPIGLDNRVKALEREYTQALDQLNYLYASGNLINVDDNINLWEIAQEANESDSNISTNDLRTSIKNLVRPEFISQDSNFGGKEGASLVASMILSLGHEDPLIRMHFSEEIVFSGDWRRPPFLSILPIFLDLFTLGMSENSTELEGWVNMIFSKLVKVTDQPYDLIIRSMEVIIRRVGEIKDILERIDEAGVDMSTYFNLDIDSESFGRIFAEKVQESANNITNYINAIRNNTD